MSIFHPHFVPVFLACVIILLSVVSFTMSMIYFDAETSIFGMILSVADGEDEQFYQFGSEYKRIKG